MLKIDQSVKAFFRGCLNRGLEVMEISLISQISFFLVSAVIGAALSLLFDVFRVINIILRFNTKRIFFEDVTYFILCAVMTFMYLLVVAQGEIRFYIIVGETVGWLIYRFSIGRLIYKCLFSTVEFGHKISKVRKPVREHIC